MNFNDINLSGIYTTEELNVITYKAPGAGKYTVRLMSGPSTIFTDDFVTDSDNSISVYCLGDILAARATEISIPFRLSFSADGAEVDSVGGQAIPSMLYINRNASGLDKPGKFLTTEEAFVVPPSADMALSLIDFNSANTVLRISDGTEHSIAVEGLHRTFRFQAPKDFGIYTACTDESDKIYIIVNPFASAHQISYRNALNAPEFLYLNAEVKITNTREASVAVSGGRRQEFDIDVKAEFEFSAKGLSMQQILQAETLTLATDIKIDGHPVVVSDLKVQRSAESQSLYELKFSASLAVPDDSVIGSASSKSRIFTPHFTSPFS